MTDHAVPAPSTEPAYEDGKLVLRLTVTRHKGGTWEVAATRADGSTARHRGMPAYDNAFYAVEDELDALHDTYLAGEARRA